MKRLAISIDPGFDCCKMVINEQLYQIPFSVEDITNTGNVFGFSKDKNYITCTYEDKKYLVGDYARKSLLEADHQDKIKAEMDLYYTMARFGTKLFEVGFNAFIGYALSKYSEYTNGTKGVEKFNLSDLPNWDVYVAVALPHENKDEIWTKHVKGYLMANHSFSLQFGESDAIEFNYELNPDNIEYNSQAICALIDVITDENGYNEEGKTILDYLPVLVLDGGYYTMGKFKLARDGRIDMPESNTDFAMNNINEAVAADIRKKKKNVYGYMIEEYYKTNEMVYYNDDNDTVGEFNVRKMRDEQTKVMATALVDYIKKQFDNLLDIKTVLVAGGTGNAYYSTILELLDKRKNLSGNIKLANKGFNGQECEPVFAIAIGCYKAMMHGILEAEENMAEV